MLNIAVLVSGGGTNLQALIDAKSEGRIKNGDIKLVISGNKNAFALKRAEDAGIKTAVFERKSFKDIKEHNTAMIEELKSYDIDLIVLAGYLSILGREFTEKYKNMIINVHPSLIPSFCGDGFYGLKVHEAALLKGVKVTGATVHFVNEVTDGGPIILQKAVEVKSGDTPELLQKRVMRSAEWELLPRAVSLFCDGRIKVDGNKVIIL
ncbi:MAG: phosphoribosylglycinamide formyltransferase [Oscillospiraceae bacterium]|jgi:phosphoribosylglycinamide formyltransferase-1|nr:phosphoribosylglycinamide formyltransferase [Oscillospiraceae bacterium]